jgi:UDP-N-acetylglucosamine--N-acetylmuramyl-(pentapeptide) pyrophosphoryl-undecaprenol N-acetylglucosamine transferase
MSGAAGQRVYIFAGGGTGGHIFPALAIAEQLRRLGQERCVFVCSARALDAEILGKERVELLAIPAMPFGVRPRALMKFARGWGPSVRAVRGLVRERRAAGQEPVLVAMGGFVAAPAARAAGAEAIPVVMVNMDAIPGKANRWLARRAARVLTSAPVRGHDWERIPPIVREAARARGDRAHCRGSLGLDPRRPTLLVTGASQGARSINRLLARLVSDDPQAFEGWQVIHQTGAGEELAAAAYAAAGIPALVRPFFDRMGECWGAADLAVSRAGAGSVAEAWANQVPTVFLPYPYHRDQHQRFNAGPLEGAGAAAVAEDLIEPGANAAGPGRVLRDLMGSPMKRDEMREAIRGLGPADGALRIATTLVALRQ